MKPIKLEILKKIDMVLAIYVYWQAVIDASTSFAYRLPEEGNYEAAVDEDNGVLLRDISGCFDKQYSKGNQVPFLLVLELVLM